MSKVVRLTDDMVRELEDYRQGLIDLYKDIDKDNPDMLKYDVERWENASYNDIISRALYMAAYHLNNKNG